MAHRSPLALLTLLAVLATACGGVVELESGDPVGFVQQPQTSQVLSADGTVLAELHAEQDRRDVTLDQMPDELVAAVVAVEDRRFFLHRGVDVPAIVRAGVRNIEAGGIEEGGSTITQQYVKNTMLGPVRTLERKIKEAALAYQLEQRHTKAEILEGYLNTIYFGHGAYGVHAAAARYFAKPVGDLTLAESTLLAGLIRSPATYDPYEHPQRATDRRETVLDAMMATGRLTSAEAAAAASAPLELAPLDTDERWQAAYAVEEARRLIATDAERFAALGQDRDERLSALYTGGLRIHTTIDLAWQRHAEAAVTGVLTEPDDPYGALVATDPATGAIRALVGGRDLHSDDPYARFNLATQGRRQVGSSFKPIVLATALSNGITPDRRFPAGATATIDDPACRTEGSDWEVSNYDGRAFGELSLREATVHSVNTVYARLAAELGPRAILATTRNLGVAGDLPEVCSLALGAGEISPLEMAEAYQPLAALGVQHDAHLIARIESADGQVLYEHEDGGRRVLDEAVAYLVTETLQEVVRRGTGVRASIDRPQAGKTGTTDDGTDAWFVGYTPELVASVWVGFPEGRIPMEPPRTRIRVEGGRWPAEIWSAFAGPALGDVPSSTFPIPAVDLVTVEVDLSRNCLPNPYTPPELIGPREYLAGTAPTEICREPTGPPDDAVPDVLGLTRDIAVRLLESKGYRVEERPVVSRIYPPGYVVMQDPAPGETVDPATGHVLLTVSVNTRERAAVPDVVGMDIDEAIELLETDGWIVEQQVGCPAAGCPVFAVADEVYAQEPVAGETVKRHSVVTLRVYPEDP
ncbi:MAG: PBP1A family penicillin-binding protein [Actinobacteria bacterium]|nr:PBP1A family penicillin-binding protein [Actinomycetota bacterium]